MFFMNSVLAYSLIIKAILQAVGSKEGEYSSSTLSDRAVQQSEITAQWKAPTKMSIIKCDPRNVNDILNSKVSLGFKIGIEDGGMFSIGSAQCNKYFKVNCITSINFFSPQTLPMPKGEILPR